MRMAAVWEDQYYEEEAEGYGTDPDSEDPLGIPRADPLEDDDDKDARIDAPRVTVGFRGLDALPRTGNQE